MEESMEMSAKENREFESIHMKRIVLNLKDIKRL